MTPGWMLESSSKRSMRARLWKELWERRVQTALGLLPGQIGGTDAITRRRWCGSERKPRYRYTAGVAVDQCGPRLYRQSASYRSALRRYVSAHGCGGLGYSCQSVAAKSSRLAIWSSGGRCPADGLNSCSRVMVIARVAKLSVTVQP
jgi:hypothetical protein